MSQRAWEELDIVVFGRKAGLTMNLEQQIAEAVPGLESKLESFEKYEDALDHCKAKKNVGFFIFIEDGNSPTTDEIFRNLVKPYEKSGWPGFGALLHDGVETVQGLKSVSKNPGFLDYRNIADFSDQEKVISSLGDLWNKFNQRVTRHFLDVGLENTLTSTAASFLPHGYLLFHEQTLNILSANLALSWKDMLVLRWNPIVTVLKKELPQTLEAHERFALVVSNLKTNASKSQSVIETIKDQTVPLAKKLLILISEMNVHRAQGTLPQFLDDLAQHGKPGAPAIFRHLAKQKAAILRLSDYRRVG